MTPKNVLWALLALTLASSMAEAPYVAHQLQPPGWWLLLSGALSHFLAYYWYRLDSQRRRFLPPRWMSSAVVGLAPLGIPLYLLRSRRGGERLRAFARLAGYLVLTAFAAMVGAFGFLMLPG